MTREYIGKMTAKSIKGGNSRTTPEDKSLNSVNATCFTSYYLIHNIQHTAHRTPRTAHSTCSTHNTQLADAEETFSLCFLVGQTARFLKVLAAFDLSLRGVAESASPSALASGRQVDVRAERRVSLARAAFKKRCVGKEQVGWMWYSKVAE